MNFQIGVLLILAGLAAARDILGRTVSFHASDACGGAAVFRSQMYPGVCFNIPAAGACEDAAFCAGAAGFETKWQNQLDQNCTAFSGSVRFGEFAFSYTYDAPNCTGTATVLPRDVVCIEYPMCGATHVNVSVLQRTSSPVQTVGDLSSGASDRWSWIL